jgi:hypothetical protein
LNTEFGGVGDTAGSGFVVLSGSCVGVGSGRVAVILNKVGVMDEISLVVVGLG